LSIYPTAVPAAEAKDEMVFANYLPLAIKPNVRSGLMHLPENSISSWADLCNEFVGAFTGGHQEPGRPSNLQILPQKEGESLRKYMQRFSRVHRNIPEIHPAVVIAAFHSNMRNRRIRSKMSVRLPKTVNELYTLADKCAQAEEGRHFLGEEEGVGIDSEDDDGTSNSKGKSKKNNKKRRDKSVLAVENSESLSSGKKAKTEVLSKEAATCASCREAVAAEKARKSDGPYCKIHRTKGHDLQECRQVEQLTKKPRAEYEKHDKERNREGNEGKGRGKEGHRGKTPTQNGRPNTGHEKKEEEESDGGDGEDTSEHEFQRATEAMCIDRGASLHSSHRQDKQWAREVNAMEPAADSRRPLKWSCTPIIFDEEDHPDRTTALDACRCWFLQQFATSKLLRCWLTAGPD
jgi:hypothetical protein